MSNLTIIKPHFGPHKGRYLIITPDGEIVEIFDDLTSAEQWLHDDENVT